MAAVVVAAHVLRVAGATGQGRSMGTGNGAEHHTRLSICDGNVDAGQLVTFGRKVGALPFSVRFWPVRVPVPLGPDY